MVFSIFDAECVEDCRGKSYEKYILMWCWGLKGFKQSYKGKSGASTICGQLYEAHTYSMSRLFALLGKMLQNQDKLTPKIRCSFFKLWYQLISGTTFEGAWELCHHLFPNHARCERKKENKTSPHPQSYGLKVPAQQLPNSSSWPKNPQPGFSWYVLSAVWGFRCRSGAGSA